MKMGYYTAVEVVVGEENPEEKILKMEWMKAV
jgi:hypothetical protein